MILQNPFGWKERGTTYVRQSTVYSNCKMSSLIKAIFDHLCSYFGGDFCYGVTWAPGQRVSNSS